MHHVRQTGIFIQSKKSLFISHISINIHKSASFMFIKTRQHAYLFIALIYGIIKPKKCGILRYRTDSSKLSVEAFFFNFNGFTNSATEIVEFSATNFTATNYFDLIDSRAVKRECSFNANA